MSIVVNKNYYYITSKDLSLIIEEHDGDLLLRHLGRKVNRYHGSNAVHERDHAFSGQLNPDVRTYSYDTQRQVVGLHGLGDFRQPSLKIQHGVSDVTRFEFSKAEVVEGMSLESKLPYPHSLEKAETLIFTLVDKVANLELKLYYTVVEDNNTIVTYSEVINRSEQAVVIHRALWLMYLPMTMMWSLSKALTLVRKRFVAKELNKVSLKSLLTVVPQVMLRHQL